MPLRIVSRGKSDRCTKCYYRKSSGERNDMSSKNFAYATRNVAWPLSYFVSRVWHCMLVCRNLELAASKVGRFMHFRDMVQLKPGVVCANRDGAWLFLGRKGGNEEEKVPQEQCNRRGQKQRGWTNTTDATNRRFHPRTSVHRNSSLVFTHASFFFHLFRSLSPNVFPFGAASASGNSFSFVKMIRPVDIIANYF